MLVPGVAHWLIAGGPGERIKMRGRMAANYGVAVVHAQAVAPHLVSRMVRYGRSYAYTPELLLPEWCTRFRPGSRTSMSMYIATLKANVLGWAQDLPPIRC
jgi:hypothetical protein